MLCTPVRSDVNVDAKLDVLAVSGDGVGGGDCMVSNNIKAVYRSKHQ